MFTTSLLALEALCERSVSEIGVSRIKVLMKKFITSDEFSSSKLGGYGAYGVDKVLSYINAESRTRLNLSGLRRQLQDGGDWYYLHHIKLNKLKVDTNGDVVPSGKEDLTKPIVVGRGYQVIDGRHRVNLAKSRGMKSIDAYLPAGILYKELMK